MARKSGTKTRTKTNAKKKKPKPRFLVQGVGIFSSIPYAGTAIETEFNAGLGNISTVLIKDELGYDPAKLKNAMLELNKRADVGLIVTIGGLVTLNQAIQNPDGATNYFISLIGGRIGVPSATTGYFLGGICLQSYNRNPLRVAEVKRRFSIALNQELCLLANPKSNMAGVEKTSWINDRIVKAEVDPGTANPAAVFQQAFADVAAIQGPRIKAVIVSADPYFFTMGAALVQEANRWIGQAPAGETRVVCYPLQEYQAHGPIGNKRVLHGPKLKKAYKDLGKKARKILVSPTSPTGTLDDLLDEVN